MFQVVRPAILQHRSDHVESYNGGKSVSTVPDYCLGTSGTLLLRDNWHDGFYVLGRWMRLHLRTLRFKHVVAHSVIQHRLSAWSKT